MFKHILIPTDGSPLADKAVKAGVSFAREIGAKVTFYHAFEDPMKQVSHEAEAIEPSMRVQFRQWAREAAHASLAKASTLAKKAGVKSNAIVAEAETPYKGIIDAAKKHRCDVIFMASHGRRGIASLMMGSVTHKVLTHCKTPVLIYR